MTATPTAGVRAAGCHPDRPRASRGLCRSCYSHHRHAGTLEQFPAERPWRSVGDFAADYELLTSEGHTLGQIAERLGMKYRTAASARRRAIAAGLLRADRRAVA